MITVTKTSSSCLSNRIVPSIYLWSHVRLHAESDLKRQMNTDRPIIRIHIRSSTTPTDTSLLAPAETLYVCPRSAVGTASQAYVERLFSVCGLLTSGHRNHMNKTLEMRMCYKLSSKMLRDSGFVF